MGGSAQVGLLFPEATRSRPLTYPANVMYVFYFSVCVLISIIACAELGSML